MPGRKPQINFQVDESLKTLYEEAKASGFSVTRLCAAGLLLLVADSEVRRRALNLLRDWENQYDDASAEEIRSFVEGAQHAVRRGAQDILPARKSRPAKKAARRGESG
jgi:hypothetical protein